jgi:hypothetical protein
MSATLTEDDIRAIASAVADEIDRRRVERFRQKFGANPGAKGGTSHLRYSTKREPGAEPPARRVGRPAKSDHDYLVAVVKTVAAGQPDGLPYQRTGAIQRALGSRRDKVLAAMRSAYDAKLIDMQGCNRGNFQEFVVTSKGREWLAENGNT